MADQKLTELAAGSGIVNATVFYGVDDPGGTPASVKYTALDLANFIGAGSATTVEIITVSGGDVSNGYLQLTGDLTSAASLRCSIAGAGGQTRGVDFEADTVNDRVTMTGFNWASEVTAGDVVTVVYE